MSTHSREKIVQGVQTNEGAKNNGFESREAERKIRS